MFLWWITNRIQHLKCGVLLVSISYLFGSLNLAVIYKNAWNTISCILLYLEMWSACNAWKACLYMFMHACTKVWLVFLLLAFVFLLLKACLLKEKKTLLRYSIYTSESKVTFFSLGSKFLDIKRWSSVGLFFYNTHQEKNKIEVHQSMAIFSQVTTTTWCT
jgi:hypothetical protein